MKVIVIPIAVGTFERFGKRQEELELRGRIELIQTTTLLRSARILRRVLRT